MCGARLKMSELILCVDDEIVSLITMKSCINSSFSDIFSVQTETDPVLALQTVREISKNRELFLVISDLKMQEMDGLDFLKKVREEFPKIKLMMITGESNKKILKEISDTGYVDVLMTKPWDRDKLIDAIQAFDLEKKEV